MFSLFVVTFFFVVVFCWNCKIKLSQLHLKYMFFFSVSLLSQAHLKSKAQRVITACLKLHPGLLQLQFQKDFSFFTSSRLVIFKAFPLIPSGVNWRMNIKAKRNVWMLKQCAMWWRGQRLAVDCVFLIHCKKNNKTKQPPHKESLLSRKDQET